MCVCVKKKGVWVFWLSDFGVMGDLDGRRLGWMRLRVVVKCGWVFRLCGCLVGLKLGWCDVMVVSTGSLAFERWCMCRCVTGGRK